MESVDILFLTLAVSIGILTIFLSVTLIYLMFILRDVTKILDSARKLIDKVDKTITKPIMMTKAVIEFVKPFIHTAEEKIKNVRKKDK